MRILLADDEPKVRQALRLLLEQQNGVTVIGEAGQAWEALAQLGAHAPDVLLLDWGLPDMDGDDLMLRLRRQFASVAVVVLSGRPEAEEMALAAGADGFVSKADPPESLLAAIASASRDRAAALESNEWREGVTGNEASSLTRDRCRNQHKEEDREADNE